MKKLNLICASIALLAAGSANAGLLSSATAGGTRFAQEIFGTATNADTAVTPGVVTYAVLTTNGIFVNANGSLYYTFRLTNGKFANAMTPANAAARISGTVITGLGAVAQPGVFSTDRTTFVVRLDFPAAATIGVGATLTFTAAATDIVDVKAALSTVGGTVSATAGLSSLVASATPGATVPADVDGPAAATTVVAQSVNGFTAAVAANPVEWATRIDVTGANSTVPGTVFTAIPGVSDVTNAPLARVTFAVPATPAQRADNTPLTLNDYRGVGATATIVVTPATGSFPARVANPSSLKLVAGLDCTAPAITGTATTITAANAGGPISIPLAQADFLANAAVSVCYTVPASPNGLQLAQVTAGVTVNTTPATALTNYAPDIGTGTGFAVLFNGALVTTPGYFPATISQFGYGTFIRVVNTGSTATAIQAAFVAQNTGVVGSPQTLPLPANYGSLLAPGASITWTGAQLEAFLGAPGVGDRPRLQISGTTSALRVQQFIQSANGTFTEVSGSIGN